MVILERKGSEKQISVDPISVRESSENQQMQMLPPKFMSCSLPNSASSSPRFPKHKMKYKNQHEARPLARQHSVALGNLERLRETHLRRSKSCGEGRASQPSLDFDLCPPVPQVVEVTSHNKGGGDMDDRFKCGACLFLPGLGKGSKTVRARKEVDPLPLPLPLSVSQRVSLEKFECGSWRSSAVINYEDDGDVTSNLFFDLPVELIRCSSVNDTDSPVTTGFVFDNNNKDHHIHHHRKGVLKSTSTTHRESSCTSSSRHVRFSTSLSPASPCITPRLHKARDDFNAFLEAQSA